jgi:hypothetical protein
MGHRTYDFIPGTQVRGATIGPGSGMGPVAQPVFKTGAVV